MQNPFKNLTTVQADTSLGIYFQGDFSNLSEIDSAIELSLAAYSYGLLKVVEGLDEFEKLEIVNDQNLKFFRNRFTGYLQSSLWQFNNEFGSIFSDKESRNLVSKVNELMRYLTDTWDNTEPILLSNHPFLIAKSLRATTLGSPSVTRLTNTGSLEFYVSAFSLLATYGLQNFPYLKDSAKLTFDALTLWIKWCQNPQSNPKKMLRSDGKIPMPPGKYIQLIQNYDDVTIVYNEKTGDTKITMVKSAKKPS